jgi:hypothetical protein
MRQGPAPVNVRSRRLRLRHVLIANSSSSGLLFPRDITALAEGCDTIRPFCAVDQCAPVKPEEAGLASSVSRFTFPSSGHGKARFCDFHHIFKATAALQ